MVGTFSRLGLLGVGSTTTSHREDMKWVPLKVWGVASTTAICSARAFLMVRSTIGQGRMGTLPNLIINLGGNFPLGGNTGRGRSLTKKGPLARACSAAV